MTRPPDRRAVQVEHIERLRLSVNGNPRFRLTFTDGSVHDTMSDASIGYSITNPEFRGLIDLWLTRAGRVRYATPSLLVSS